MAGVALAYAFPVDEGRVTLVELLGVHRSMGETFRVHNRPVEQDAPLERDPDAYVAFFAARNARRLGASAADWLAEDDGVDPNGLRLKQFDHDWDAPAGPTWWLKEPGDDLGVPCRSLPEDWVSVPFEQITGVFVLQDWLRRGGPPEKETRHLLAEIARRSSG